MVQSEAHINSEGGKSPLSLLSKRNIGNGDDRNQVHHRKGFFRTLGEILVWFPCVQKRRKELNRDLTSKDLSLDYASAEGGSLTSVSSSGLLPGFSAQAFAKGSKAVVFTMAQLSKATGNFNPSYKVGQGSFGIVYRGKLPDGTAVAIKRARKDAFEARMIKEFETEVDMMASVDHLNLVKLIGFLEEGNELILVEEYVPNGNLRQHLDCAFGAVVDLSMRLDIAIDIAHALTYLHVYADKPIIHRDVKSSNILLTENFRAKVADFGFSRAGPSDFDATHVSTQVKGTAGYLDPEYLKSYQLTQKSDVYSFGILLIEMLTGRRPIEQDRPIEERITIRWAFKKYLDGKILDLLDPNLEKTSAAQMAIEKMSELAFQCSAPTKQDRPTMKRVAEHLWAFRRDYQELIKGQA
eukprot:c27905_g1_i1 orf=872-2101(-)